jgi:hypothetical protein
MGTAFDCSHRQGVQEQCETQDTVGSGIELNCWTRVFPLVILFGIVLNAIKDGIFEILGIMTPRFSAEQQFRNLGLPSVPCSHIKKCQGICEIGDMN